MRETHGGSRAPTLPREARLRKRRDFLALRRRGQRSRTPHFLIVRDKGTPEPTRLGITVTKKIGCAVIRNRIKRGVREAFRHVRHDLPTHMTVLVIAQRGAGELSSAAVADEIYAALLPAKQAPAC
ncbi:MAG: ribonuclease P protein component [Deltaproteobacteria bacterium]